jgi:hypothetical protein
MGHSPVSVGASQPSCTKLPERCRTRRFPTLPAIWGTWQLEKTMLNMTYNYMDYTAMVSYDHKCPDSQKKKSMVI